MQHSPDRRIIGGTPARGAAPGRPRRRGFKAIAALWAAATACATHGPSPGSPNGPTGPGTGGGPEPLSPSEILERLKASNRVYAFEPIGSISDLAAQEYARELWPPAEHAVEFPMVETRGVRRVLSSYPANDAALQILQEAEPLVTAKKFAAAEALYRRALDVAPGYYLTLLNYGGCAQFTGRFEAALDRYEQAIRANPFDHRGYFFKANALTELGRIPEALDAYAWALTVRPRHTWLLAGIDTREPRLGVVVQGDLLLPKAVVREQADRIVIEFDGSAHWLAFGACKALWVGEAAHRREMTGLERRAFTSAEERECLAGLLAVYATHRAQGAVQAEPDLDRLVDVVRSRMADEWIIYELASRRSPHASLALPAEMHRRIHAFVLRYVLVSRAQALP